MLVCWSARMVWAVGLLLPRSPLIFDSWQAKPPCMSCVAACAASELRSGDPACAIAACSAHGLPPAGCPLGLSHLAGNEHEGASEGSRCCLRPCLLSPALNPGKLMPDAVYDPVGSRSSSRCHVRRCVRAAQTATWTGTPCARRPREHPAACTSTMQVRHDSVAQHSPIHRFCRRHIRQGTAATTGFVRWCSRVHVPAAGASLLSREVLAEQHRFLDEEAVRGG